jgi:hypothetical protein
MSLIAVEEPFNTVRIDWQLESNWKCRVVLTARIIIS